MIKTFPKTLMSPTNWLQGIDLSFALIPSPAWAKRRIHQEGVNVLVQCLWTGGYQAFPALVHVASRNLRLWRESGGITAGYINTSPWYTADVAIAEGRRAAGNEWPYLSTVFNDVELEGVTEERVKRVSEWLRAAGKGGHIYTARWFWAGKLGNPKWEWTRDYGLWNAYYDLDPDVDFPARPYGLWSEGTLAGEQYQGTVKLDGIDVDRDVFNPEYLQGGDMPLADADFQRIAEILHAQNAQRIIQDPRDGKVYHYALGMRGHIQNPAVFTAAGFDATEIQTLTGEDIDAIPTFEDAVRSIVHGGATAAEIVDELVKRLKQ